MSDTCSHCIKDFIDGDPVVHVPRVLGGKYVYHIQCAHALGMAGIPAIYRSSSPSVVAGGSTIGPSTGTIGPSIVNGGATPGRIQFNQSSRTPPQYIPIAEASGTRSFAIKGRNDVTLFEVTQEGKVTADWKALMELKDRWLANDIRNDRPETLAFAASLWFARNT